MCCIYIVFSNVYAFMQKGNHLNRPSKPKFSRLLSSHKLLPFLLTIPSLSTYFGYLATCLGLSYFNFFYLHTFLLILIVLFCVYSVKSLGAFRKALYKFIAPLRTHARALPVPVPDVRNSMASHKEVHQTLTVTIRADDNKA